MLQIDVHPAMGERNFEQEVAASLQANELDPKLLYVTPRQTELWRQVFLRHSPIHRNPEFARIYRDAFAHVAGRPLPKQVRLVGLGCGTGLKEAELCSHLVANGHRIRFSAIDASRDLVAESAQRLMGLGAGLGRQLVCDLAEVDFLKNWLAHTGGDLPRIFTFFGLVPNLQPSLVIELLRGVLRPGDILLASAHLVPAGEGVDVDAAMQKILPQYDNPETLAWLDAALDQWKLREIAETPRIFVGEMKSIPAIFGTARSKKGNLLIFRSLRYTPALFEDLLKDHGLETKCLAVTACCEEGIWSVQLP